MSEKERVRKAILEKVIEGYITLKEGAIRMRISYRQAKRILRCYKKDGDIGLLHKNRGNKKVGHGFSQEIKEEILTLYQDKYYGFGPTLATEKFANQYSLSRETLRKWLRESGILVRTRKRKMYRKRRERKERFGEMLQIDGSIHPWFGKEYGKFCLLNIVDDATGMTLSRMANGETTKILLITLKKWIELYGIPQSVYVDRKSVYLGIKNLSVFEQVCARLGIEVITAYSPQAKGRVERSHQVYQDRLVKELRLEKITTVDEANKLLSSGFIDNLNKKFSVCPISHENAHTPLLDTDLDNIIVWLHKRQLQNDWTISFDDKCYQISDGHNRLIPKSYIEIKVCLDGKIFMFSNGHLVGYNEILERPKKLSNYIELGINKKGKNKTNSPWRQFNPYWLNKKAMGNIQGDSVPLNP